jgi:predicted protein tyrosine phosphatase
MHDISDVDKMTCDEVPPCAEEVKKLIKFGEAWNPYTTVVVHCMAGVSRSPAAALTLLAMKNPGRETDAVRALRLAVPYCRPNSLFVEIADDLLGLQGRLSAALRVMPLPKTFLSSGGVAELSPFI